LSVKEWTLNNRLWIQEVSVNGADAGMKGDGYPIIVVTNAQMKQMQQATQVAQELEKEVV
jgi:alcohol dehydrogenase class IV